MKKLKTRTRAILITFAIVSAAMLVLCVIGVWIEQRHAEFGRTAFAIGMDRAKLECQKEGLHANVCDSLKGTSTYIEDFTGTSMWVIYADSAEGRQFGASITVEYEDGGLQVTDYGRNS